MRLLGCGRDCSKVGRAPSQERVFGLIALEVRTGVSGKKRSAKLRYVFETGRAWETWKGCEARAARKLTGHRRLGG